jgi:Short-chain alcohol dehydrogenase of unknown specificity
MSKLAIITGADGGMGTEITRAVAQAGYHVIMLCYTLFKGEERKNQLILETGNKEIEVRQVDLSSMASVTNIAEDLLGRGKHIDFTDEQCGNHEFRWFDYNGGWFGIYGSRELCGPFFTDFEIIASDGTRNPDCEHGFLYVFHREDYS